MSVTKYNVYSYAHMCCDEHVQIGHDDSDHEQCPLCRVIYALQAVVENINDYERVNNLAPNPGRTECWDSVAHAKDVLASVGGKASD